ncbi:M16 family metallopeptidase [Thermodesulfobacteriota bacterium]
MYNKTVLDNGVKIISEKIPNLRSISLGIWVNAGSRDESEEENGISHFIEHMIFRGTDHRSGLDIAKELDAIGGLSNAFTGKENTCFYARVLDENLVKLSDILSDIFLRSKFDFTDVERERQVVLQEIAMVEDNPEDNIHVMLNRNFWHNHPIGMPILGTEENVSRLGRANIEKYIKKFYVPEKILIVAAGNVEHKELVCCFEPLFGIIEKSETEYKRTAPETRGRFSVHFKELEQAHICLGGKAPSLRNSKRFACAVINTILGGNMSSRLFQEIREKNGLAYSVYSFLSSYLDSGLFGIYVGSDPSNVNPVLAIIQREIEKICRGDLTKQDLADAKENIVGGIYLGSESADSRMMRNAKNEFVFQRYVDYGELVSEIKKVTINDVVEVALEVFKSESITFVALGSLQEEDVDKSNLEYYL